MLAIRKTLLFSLILVGALCLTFAPNVTLAADKTASTEAEMVRQLDNERIALERQLAELIRMAGPQINDQNSLAARRIGEVRDRLALLEQRRNSAQWTGVQGDSLRGLREKFAKEKESYSKRSQQLRAEYIKKAEAFLRDWRSNPALANIQGNAQSTKEMLAQLNLRLAELYALQALDIFGEEMEQWSAAGGKGDLPKIHYEKAERTFRDVLREYTETSWAGNALYSLAFIKAEQAGTDVGVPDANREESRRLYLQLLREYPETRYKEDALFALGGYWFSTPPKSVKVATTLDSAQSYFEKVLQDPQSRKYEDALYMMGWISFRRPDYGTALDYFVRTVNYSWDHPYEGSEAGKGKYTRDAIKYMAGIFAQPSKDWNSSGVANALAFSSLDSIRPRRFGVVLMDQIGDQLANNLNEYDSALFAWRGAIKIDPTNEMAPKIQQKIIDAAFNNKKDVNLWYAEGKKEYDDYKTDEQWWSQNSKARVRKQTKTMVRETYTKIVAFAVARAVDKERPDYNAANVPEAIKACREFVSSFPGDSVAYEWNYQLAALLATDATKQEEAFAEYGKVISNYPFTKYKKDAASQQLLVSDELAKTQLKATPYQTFSFDSTTGLPVAKREELTPAESMLVASADAFAKMFPDEQQIAPAYLYKAGSVNYQRGRITEANGFFERITQTYPKSKQAEPSYKLYVEGFLINRDFAGAERVTKQLATASVSDSLKRFAGERRAIAIFSNATTTAISAETPSAEGGAPAGDAKEKYERAGDDYMRVALEIPDFKDADLALANAAVNYRKASKPEKEIEAYTTIANKFPNSKRAAPSLYNAGLIYMTELKRPADAAKTFDRVVTSYPTGEYDVKQAMINASVNYEEAKDYGNAVRVNQQFAEKFTSDPIATTLLFKTAGLYLKMGDVAAANRIYDDFSRRFPDSPNSVVSHYERGKYAQDHGDNTIARSEYQAAVDRHNALVRAGKNGYAEYASKSLYQIIAWDLDSYKAVAYTGFEKFKEGEAQRKDKKAKREALFEKIKQLVELAQAEQFQGLYWAGELNENLATTHLAQRLPETSKTDEQFTNRQKVIDETIAILWSAVNEYANSLDKFTKAIEILNEEKVKQAADRDRLQAWVDENLASNPAGYTDSTTTLEVKKAGVARIETALNEALKWQVAVREKAPELAFRMAELKRELVFASIATPDVAPKQIRDQEIGKTVYRQQVLFGAIGPFSKELFDAYLYSIHIARDAGFEEKWAVPARQGMKSALDTVLASASELNDRWFRQYHRQHEIIQELLPKGPDAKDKMRRDVLLVGRDMLSIIDFYAGEQSVTKVMNVIIDSLMAKIAGDSGGVALMQPAIDAVISWYSRESDRADQLFTEAKAAEMASREKLRETTQPQYEDAFTAYENVSLIFREQRKELLSSANDIMERNTLNSTALQNILERLAQIDPEIYGVKVGMKLVDNWLGSDESWIGTDVYVEGYTDPNLDVSSWHYVTNGKMEGVALDTFVAAKAKPVTYLKPNEMPVAGSKRWFRKAIWIPERVTSAELRVVGDSKISAFVNKDYIFETAEGTDWKQPIVQDVSASVKPGYNVIAFELVDATGSGSGFVAALRYRTVPGDVTPVLPEPVNAGTIRNIGKAVEVSAPSNPPQEQKPAETPATPTETPTPAPVAPESTPAPTPATETPATTPATTPAVEPPAVTPATTEPTPDATPASTPATETPATTPATTPAVEPPAVTPATTEPTPTPVVPETTPATTPAVEPPAATPATTEPTPTPVVPETTPATTPVVEPPAATPATTEPTPTPVVPETTPATTPVVEPPATTPVVPDTTQSVPPDTTRR